MSGRSNLPLVIFKLSFKQQIIDFALYSSGTIGCKEIWTDCIYDIKICKQSITNLWRRTEGLWRRTEDLWRRTEFVTKLSEGCKERSED